MDIKTNPNDLKVVQFTNGTDFGFTPEMGCMYDGRPISGITGAPGINPGESMTLPYHVGHRLATNLAKVVKLRRAPIMDEANNPVGKPLWSDEDLENLKNSFLTELYSETRPIALSQTDMLMAKVEEYKKMVEHLVPKVAETPVVESVKVEDSKPVVFSDKQEVMAELKKRGIAFDARQNKATLEKLIV